MSDIVSGRPGLRAGLHADDRCQLRLAVLALKPAGVNAWRSSRPFSGLAIVIEFITTHFITPAVIVVGRKDIGIGKMVIECRLQGLHATGPMKKKRIFVCFRR